MKYFFKKFRGPIGRIGTAVLVFGVAGAVLAYLLGYYDFSFLDRYDFLDELLDEPSAETGSANPFDSLFGDALTETEPSGNSPTETQPNPGQNPGETLPEEPAVEAGEVKSVLSVHDTGTLADLLVAHPLVTEVEGQPAVSYEPGKSVLARLRFSYKLPDEFSLRRRAVKKLEYVVPEQYGEYIAEYNTVREDRPAIELYMGYLLIDNGDSLYLISSDGTPLCTFSDSIYAPAYTRDREGRPLFVKETGEGGKAYFYLSEDGRNFVKSDYDDAVDSRGLYFDYPAGWGVTDAPEIIRVKDEESGEWGYVSGEVPITETEFTNAFPYVGGRACVTVDENRGGMYFLNENGRQVQKTFVLYLSDLNRYSIWDYAMPASRGIESLGFFYYDHGLTRVRYQIIDNYNWVVRNQVRVVSDEDRLIYADGTEFALPSGYTLKGYSEGMILLEKDGAYGFMDYTGGWIAEPVFASATPFVNGLSVLGTKDGRFGMIDREGNIVLTFTYDYISQNSDGLVTAYRSENGWRVFRVVTEE